MIVQTLGLAPARFPFPFLSRVPLYLLIPVISRRFSTPPAPPRIPCCSSKGAHTEVSSRYRDGVVFHAAEHTGRGMMICFVRLFDRSSSRIPRREANRELGRLQDPGGGVEPRGGRLHVTP
jgi:hypothetical protein